MSKKIVIVSGGELEESFVLSELETLDSQFIIGVDKGMEFLYHHKILPSYIVGDFDSVDQKIGDYYCNETKVPIREFNPVKDASDTEIAIRLAMTLGAKEILILGATGGRIDHLWANVQSLAIPFKAGIDAVIMDTQNKIRLIGGGETHLKKGETYGLVGESGCGKSTTGIFQCSRWGKRYMDLVLRGQSIRLIIIP